MGVVGFPIPPGPQSRGVGATSFLQKVLNGYELKTGTAVGFAPRAAIRYASDKARLKHNPHAEREEYNRVAKCTSHAPREV